jgi:hypothetical protein
VFGLMMHAQSAAWSPWALAMFFVLLVLVSQDWQKVNHWRKAATAAVAGLGTLAILYCPWCWFGW